VERGDPRTNIQNQSPGGRLRGVDFVCAHSMHNRRHEVDVEDGVDIHQVEHDCSSEEPDASKPCHDERR
jgi:hypothetical protein